MLSFAVVTPSLNQGRFVERTVRSVLDQAYPWLDYVVCDGGSTDATLQVLQRFSQRLRFISEPDGGQAEAVNKGMRTTSGELIGWLNSDDVYAPGALARVAAVFEARPELDVLYGDAQLIDAEDRILGAYYTEPWNPRRLVDRCFLCQPAVFFRRRVVERFGGLDQRLSYCMDYEYWLRLAAGGAMFEYLPSVLAASRLHRETKTLSARLAVHAELDRMLRERLGRVPDSWLLNHAHTLVELSHAKGRRRPAPYALEVVWQAMRLSREWNGGISRGLLVSALGPLATGARRRLSGSPSRTPSLVGSSSMPGAQPCLRRVSIDLTPLQPGGENGGAKLVARSLVQQFGVLAPETQFTLLTSAVSHTELADLDAPNVRRECVDADLSSAALATGSLSRPRLAARVLVDTLVPSETTRTRIKDGVWTLVKRQRRARVASAQPSDLHFCPFTAPFFFDARVPLVSLVHDLQFLEHPLFFEEHKRSDRYKHFLDACERSERLICVSEFVRQTVLASCALPPERVETVYSAVLHASQVEPDAAASARRVLDGVGIASGARYLLYPANVWPHKNHHLLLDAFAAYLGKFESSDLALVCTGAPSQAAEELKARAQRVLPPGRFGFAGFLPEQEFGALLEGCRALIFPSLYEGFGLPLLEAMACQRPVLCSNTSSLPEVAGDAAILFDPQDASALVGAIERLETDPALERELIERGRQRVAYFGSARDMAARYLAVFERVVNVRAGRPGKIPSG